MVSREVCDRVFLLTGYLLIAGECGRKLDQICPANGFFRAVAQKATISDGRRQ